MNMLRRWWCERAHRLSWPRDGWQTCVVCARRYPTRVDFTPTHRRYTEAEMTGIERVERERREEIAVLERMMR